MWVRHIGIYMHRALRDIKCSIWNWLWMLRSVSHYNLIKGIFKFKSGHLFLETRNASSSKLSLNVRVNWTYKNVLKYSTFHVLGWGGGSCLAHLSGVHWVLQESWEGRNLLLWVSSHPTRGQQGFPACTCHLLPTVARNLSLKQEVKDNDGRFKRNEENGISPPQRIHSLVDSSFFRNCSIFSNYWYLISWSFGQFLLLQMKTVHLIGSYLDMPVRSEWLTPHTTDKQVNESSFSSSHKWEQDRKISIEQKLAKHPLLMLYLTFHLKWLFKLVKNKIVVLNNVLQSRRGKNEKLQFHLPLSCTVRFASRIETKIV